MKVSQQDPPPRCHKGKSQVGDAHGDVQGQSEVILIRGALFSYSPAHLEGLRISQKAMGLVTSFPKAVHTYITGSWWTKWLLDDHLKWQQDQSYLQPSLGQRAHLGNLAMGLRLRRVAASRGRMIPLCEFFAISVRPSWVQTYDHVICLTAIGKKAVVELSVVTGWLDVQPQQSTTNFWAYFWWSVENYLYSSHIPFYQAGTAELLQRGRINQQDSTSQTWVNHPKLSKNGVCVFVTIHTN